MDGREREEGISLSEICRRIGKKFWWIAGISVVFALGMTLVVALLINPRIASYSLEFLISYPASETAKYPDGTPFSYREMISLSVLQGIKESSESFSSVNVQKMAEEDDISVEAETRTVDGSVAETGSYTVTVSGAYFSNRTQATNFLRAIAKAPIDLVREKAGSLNYLLDGEVFASASFTDRLALLCEQKQTLLDQYDEWISLFRENYTVGGKTLKNYRAEVAVLYSEAVQQRFAAELEQYGYVSEESLEATIIDLKAERRLNESKIEQIRALIEAYYGTGAVYSAAARASEETPETGGTTGTNVIVDAGEKNLFVMLAELEMRNIEIDDALSMLTEENVLAFGERIHAEYEQLKAAADTMSSVATAIYEQESSVVFSTSRAAKTGDLSPVLVCAASLILAFFVGSAIAVGRGRRGAEEEAGRSEEPPRPQNAQ